MEHPILYIAASVGLALCFGVILMLVFRAIGLLDRLPYSAQAVVLAGLCAVGVYFDSHRAWMYVLAAVGGAGGLYRRRS